MVEKQLKTSAAKDMTKSKLDRGKPGGKASGSSPEPVAVDRPGFDLGGSTGKTSAGTGLGLGNDSFENRRGRSLPGRQGRSKK